MLKLSDLKSRIFHPRAFIFSLILFLLFCLFTSLYYLKIAPLDSLAFICWIMAVSALINSFFPTKVTAKTRLSSTRRFEIFLLLFVIVLYFASHLWNFSTAPWNQNGLFDDAAWDIYFAKNHVFPGSPFQPAFFDTVGYISREVIFHYYISIFFKIFGYNLFVFNISLLILGLITVIFTVFCIQKLFNHPLVTIISALIINFFPLHYLHIFFGHRYAIAAPLMTVSLYYLYTGFINKSSIRLVISSLFAALCLGSSIIGRQYIYGLILSLPFILLTSRQKRSFNTVSLCLIWLIGFIVSAAPLLIYIAFNSSAYVGREQNLFREFISSGQTQVYISQLKELFFAPFTYRRWALSDFPLIPFAYFIPLILGLFVALLKKHFEIFWLSLIPIVAAFIAGAYDFRVLLATPIWVIGMAFGLDYLFQIKHRLLIVATVICLFFGLIPSMAYLWKVSRDPNHIHLLPHKDVAVSRLIQDIVVNADNPNSQMKNDEFNRPVNMEKVPFDTFVCPTGAYAIAHLFLQNYHDKQILAFIDQGNQLLNTTEEIYNDNIKAIEEYRPAGKDLKLVWEISDKSAGIVELFKQYRHYGHERVYFGESDGNQFSLYVLTINNENIKQFQQDLLTRI